MGDSVSADELRKEVSRSIEGKKPTDRFGQQLVAICESAVRIHGGKLRPQDREQALGRSLCAGLRLIDRIKPTDTPNEVFNYFFTVAVREISMERRRAVREAKKHERIRNEMRPDRHYSRNGPR